ncbi:MAG: hypothetical protein LBG59_07535 [Candidatus Peribacteria bacterium]|jgi:hypothetical protein|nr:hypothetical protein [Candidatus Peribacteria bacterium]
MPNNILSTDLYFDEEAHLKKLDDIFLESVTDKLSEVMGLKFFDEKTKIRRNSTYEVSSGLTGVKYIPENADYPEAGGEEPVSISLTKYKYGADVIVTEECKLFDEYDKIEDRIRSITDDALDKLDTCLAEVWLRGFSTDNYTNVL